MHPLVERKMVNHVSRRRGVVKRGRTFIRDALLRPRVMTRSDERGVRVFASERGLIAALVSGRKCRRRPGPYVTEEIDPLDQFHREEPVVSVRDQLVEGHEV